MTKKGKLFWPLVLTITLLDCTTKQVAEQWLDDGSREIFGDLVKFTLVYNSGGAMGLHFDILSRWSLVLLAIASLFMILWMYAKAGPEDKWQVLALALISGGALGNAIDRVRSHRGVVDFIDAGIGDYRFYTFNIADMAVTFGAIALLLILWTRASRQQYENRATTNQ